MVVKVERLDAHRVKIFDENDGSDYIELLVSKPMDGVNDVVDAIKQAIAEDRILIIDIYIGNLLVLAIGWRWAEIYYPDGKKVSISVEFPQSLSKGILDVLDGKPIRQYLLDVIKYIKSYTINAIDEAVTLNLNVPALA